MDETIRQRDWIRIMYKGTEDWISMFDVEYIEAEEYLSKLNTAGETIVCAKRLGFLCEKFASYGFVRCHKGFVVNLNKIKRVRAAEITLASGNRIPIGRVYKKEIMAAYQNFLMTNEPCHEVS